MRTGSLLRIDALRTVRDPMMIGLALVPPALALALRTGGEAALARAPLEHGPIVALAVLLLTTPLMFGFVAALMLIDERDEGVLTAVCLTPAGLDGFLLFRVSVPVVWSALLTLLAVPTAGIVPIGAARLAALAIVCGVQAALMPALLGAVGANRVEGIALAKVATVVVALGALGVLLPGTIQWLAWPSPHYWLVRLLLASDGAPLAATLAAALLVHGAVLAGLVRLLRH